MKLVSVVICGDDVEEQDVFRLLVQAGHLKLEVRKHLAAREGERERSSLIQFGPTRSRGGRKEGEGEAPKANNGLSRVGLVRAVSQSVQTELMPPPPPPHVNQFTLPIRAAVKILIRKSWVS